MNAKRMLAFILAAALVFGDVTPVLAAAPSEYTEQDVIPKETVSEEQPLETADPEQNGDSAVVNPDDGGSPSDSENSEAGGGDSGTGTAPGESTPDDSLPDPSTTPDEDASEDTEDTGDTDTWEKPGDADGTESETPVSEETINDGMESPSAEDELVFEEDDASEYILQAGGNGILPEDENGGMAVFSVNEERLRATIAAGLRSRKSEIDISSYGANLTSVREAVSRVLNSNPDLFFVESRYSYRPNSSGIVLSIFPNYSEKYNESSTEQYENAVQEAMKSINDQMTDLEKALALHDYLVLNCAYENDGKGNYENYNAYNALVDRECVCQGYTLAYIELLQRADIPVSYATSDAMNHIWNLVELNGKWYHVDATWDDPTPDLAGRVNHNNFLRSDSGITERKHYSWVAVDNITCTDDSYASNQFWNELSTAVFYEDDVCYYLSASGSINRRSRDGSEEKLYQMADTIWPVWNGSGYWGGIFSGLSRSGDFLYCNDKLYIYRISLSSSTAAEVYKYEDGDGYLYGSCVRDDEIHLAVTQNPNNIPDRKTVLLPQEELEPFMNPRFSWNTVDGGTIRSTNTSASKMKLIIFAPVNRIAKDSLYPSLLLGKKYIDAVVLDTSRMSDAEIRTRRSESEKLMGIQSNTSALTYCYDTIGTGVQNAFLTYCAQSGIESEYTENTMACFLIDQNNRIVHWDVRSAYEDSPMSMLHPLASVINQNGYMNSGLASAGAQIRENKAGRITIQWNAVPGASGYRIYSADQIDGPYMECSYKSTVDKREWTDEFVPVRPDKTNENRYYKVIAVDSYGITGDPGIPVTNEGMPTEQDPLSIKELHLLDEEGNVVTSVDLHVGETRHFGLELERYNGTKVRIDHADYTEWGIWKPREEFSGENLTISDCQIDKSEEYAFWWYKELTNQSLGSVTGVKVTDSTQRYLSCQVRGRAGDYSYDEHLFVPVHVTEAEAGVTYPQPDRTPEDCYTDQDAVYRYIREQIRAHASEISFCVPQEIWDEWSQGHIMNGEAEWTPFWEAVDFYKDREDMKPWEGDYLFYSLAPFTFGGIPFPYGDTTYQIYTINCTYWDDKSQEDKVTDRMQELIHEPGGALYAYQNSPEHEIVKACMTWIRNNVSYIGTSDARYHSAYSALFNKKATCEGYSLLLYRMLREFGISNRILMGVDEGAHTYNIVELEGQYYYTDPSGNILLKGSNHFSHAAWQDRFLDDVFTERVASRISTTDYVYVPKYVHLLQRLESGDESIVGYYRTFAEAAEAMEANGTYRIVLLGNVSLRNESELDLPETIDCEINLNGYTLTVPSVPNGGRYRIRADLYGGDTKKGIIKTAKNQYLILDQNQNGGMSVRDLTFSFDAASTTGGLVAGTASAADRQLAFTNVTVTGTPNMELGSNVTMDASSNFAVGTLKAAAASEHVVLNGKVTAKTFEYAAKDMFVDNLTVSGGTTVQGDSRLRVTGTAVFAKVTVSGTVFYLDLIRTMDASGQTIHDGTAKFTNALVKSADSDYAVELNRWKMTEGNPSELTADPLMPDDALGTITSTESACPTAYFHIPEDSHGRDLSLRREGNVLKVKGIVVEVSREGEEKTHSYVSFDEAVSRLTADFGKEKGNYTFTFLSNAVMTKDLTLPANVTGLRLESRHGENGWVFAQLDLKGFTLSTSAHVTLCEGLQLFSIGRQGTLKLTGTGATAENPDFQVDVTSEEMTWVDALGQELNPQPFANALMANTVLHASGGIVVLDAKTTETPLEDQKIFRLDNVTAKGLYVKNGKWSMNETSVSSVYRVEKQANGNSIILNLTNSTAEIDGHMISDSKITMTNSRLSVGEDGKAEIQDVVVKSAFSKESAVNGYTLENRGEMTIFSLQMPSTSGTFRNEGSAMIVKISGLRNFENGSDAWLMCKSFMQVSGGKSRLEKNSVMILHEKAVIYNAELGGAYFYQLKDCSTAFEGKVTQSAELPEGTRGLQYGFLSQATYERLHKEQNGTDPDEEDVSVIWNTLPEAVPVEEIRPQTRLFSTRIAVFPTEYIHVLQPNTAPDYPRAYQIGQNVQVGKEWIVISARKVNNSDEQQLKSFIRWSDAVTYLSNLSNPNMVYIVDILDDLDIEQGLTMPAKSAGILFRGTGMPDLESDGGNRPNVLTYTGDLNLTTNVEFFNIKLRAKNSKTGAEYKSAVKLNGNTLAFYDNASAVFASVSGTAASALELDGGSIEVHGAVNVGRLEGFGNLTGLATVTRDKNKNITAVNPQITLSGQTGSLHDGNVSIELKEKVTVNKVVSYVSVDFSGEAAAKIRADGIRLAKSANADPGRFEFFNVSSPEDGENSSGSGTLTRKNGYLVWTDGSDYAFDLCYEGMSIPCKTFAEAVAEINRLKTRRHYVISVNDTGASGIQPAVLTMPGKNCISGLYVEGNTEDGTPVVLPYLGNLTLTTDTALTNIEFQQMAKDTNGIYVPVNELKNDQPSPTTLSTGGYVLRIDGMITFNTPLILDGVNSGTLDIEEDGCLQTLTNGIKEEIGSGLYEGQNVIAGSIKRFKTFNLHSGQNLTLKPYDTVSSKGVTTTTVSALQVTGMRLDKGADLSIENGNATIRDLTLYEANLAAMGAEAGKVSLTNVTLEGISPSIAADREFTISGTLTNRAATSNYAPVLFTRQKPSVNGVAQMPYLDIKGKVVTESEEKIEIGVQPNDCTDTGFATLKDAPGPSGQLLTAKSAAAECFAVYYDMDYSDPYGPDQRDGYMLVKSGSNIYAYNGDQVAVALCRGTVEGRRLEYADVLNYYPGWQEAVAALNARNQAKETYTLLLLKDIGSKEKPLSLAMPSKAAMVYVAGALDVSEDGTALQPKNLYYQNTLTSGTNMVFSDVCMNPITARGKGTALGFSIGNFSLTLNNIGIGGLDSGMALKDITGKGKGSVTLSSEELTFTGGISGVTELTVQKPATVKGAVKAATLTLENGIAFTAEGAVTVTDVRNRSGQNTLIYGRTAKNATNLTINGKIINEGSGDSARLRLKMMIPGGKGLTDASYRLTGTPLNENGYQVKLTDEKKLAVMPKASAADLIFYIGTDTGDISVAEQDASLVKAGKGLYLADNDMAPYHVSLEVKDSADGTGKSITCLDLAQAVNEINVLADKDAVYTIRLGGKLSDTNITDANPYSTLTLPGSGKAAEVILSGRPSENITIAEGPALTFSGNITAYGNVKLEYLTFDHVKGLKDKTPADFNIQVTGNAKTGGASLTLEHIRTTGDEKWDWFNQKIKDGKEEAGFISQISGTKNVTDIHIIESQLRLKTGLTNVRNLSLTTAKLITCKNSAVNDLSMGYSSWDALGATTIANITEFRGQADGYYLASKQAAKTFLPQLTVNGKITAEKVPYKVIAASAKTTEITYVSSYRDVKLIKLPKEAAEKISLLWSDNTGYPESGGIAAEDICYYKDISSYVICGDKKDMVIRLTGKDSADIPFADTYAKCYQDAVTIINNLNDPKASYTLELLKPEILTGKNGAFGTMAFPSNNKAVSVTVKAGGDNAATLKFSGNLTAYGNIILENVTLQCVKKANDPTPTAFNFSINGAKDASSLTLSNVKTSGGAWKDINGNNKASVTLNSKDLVVSGSITGVPGLTVQQNAEVTGAVKATTLTLKDGVTFTTKGAVTVTDIVSIGKTANTLVYGRNAKNATNLTVNGTILNQGERTDVRLILKMMVPEPRSLKDYELTMTPLNNAGYKTTIGDVKKLAVIPKASIQDFDLYISCNRQISSAGTLVKAEKGLYLLSEDKGTSPLPYTVRLTSSARAGEVLCLDLAQAVKEINTLADGTADYTLKLNSVCGDANITDSSAYSALTMPGNGKAASVTLKGADNSETTLKGSTLTFSGNISMAGSLTMEDIVLNPVKSVSNHTPADFNLSVTGNAKTGAQLTLRNVKTAADDKWNFTNDGMTMAEEETGFINQISGSKNVTNVTIEDSRLRLKTGLTNVNGLFLTDTRLISCKGSAVNELSMKNSSWDTLGATTIATIQSFIGSDGNHYLASRQIIDKNTKVLLPQLTLSGKAEPASIACRVITADSTATEFHYAESYDEVKLLKALKEDADRFTVAGQQEAGGQISYKDTSGYVIRGSSEHMQVRITREDALEGPGTYAKCYLDAVTIINNMNDPKASYILELKAGEILTGKGGTAYGALTLPTKTSGIKIWGELGEEDEPLTVIPYTGTLKPACPVYFDGVILTEGAIKNKVFVPSYQITPVLGNKDVGFVRCRTMENPNAPQLDVKIDLVCASVSASKGVLALDNEIMHVKGSFVVPKLQAAGNTAILGDKAMTLTDISGIDNGETNLMLAPRFTAITKAGQQSVTQLSINGTISDKVTLTIAPLTYRLSDKSYDWMTAYEANAMLTTGEKLNAGQKFANLSKNTMLPLKMYVSYMDGNEHKDIDLSENSQFFRPHLSGNGLYIMKMSVPASVANEKLQ